ncbi:DUF4174 domain-containing protein [Sediminicola sp. 1XM1-17]|uniref:DUF4174 domain-containing protein n=1 Tax=Sediminicola sp. 1XM1-17 TaxID=3127702 RepID=UPI00307786D2
MNNFKRKHGLGHLKEQTFVLSLFVVLFSTLLQGQELSSHQWKNRLLLILVDNESDDIYKAQIAELKAHQKGMEERKLLTYQILPSRYSVGLTGQQWQRSKKLYQQYKKTNASFEIVLIGLDGGVKLPRSNFMSSDALFDIIDAMPMRIREKQ